MRVTWYTGTPKTFSNTIQQKWDQSSQNEWIIKCPHCGQYQVLGIKNLSPTAFLCRKCRMDLGKECIINGFWKPLQPDKKLKGFRISQLMVPWITAPDIWAKYTTYSLDKFHNEVLGRSYENASKPFTPLMLGQISANHLTLYNRADGQFANRPVYMGVDWGTGEKSFTVVKIYSRNDEGKFQMIYIKRYAVGEELEVDYQMRDICYLMDSFKICKAVVDWGFGYDRYKKLQQIFGHDRVTACYYSFNQRAKKSYDQEQQRWIVNRTQVIQEYVNDIANMRIIWPGASKAEFPWLYDHHLAEQAEYRKAKSGRSEDLMYTHPEGSPDDGVHAGVYARLAEEIYLETGQGAITFSSVNEYERYSSAW